MLYINLENKKPEQKRSGARKQQRRRNKQGNKNREILRSNEIS